MPYSQQQWLHAAQQQPTLPENVPTWLRRFAADCRAGDIHDLLNDKARIVPDKDADGHSPRYSAVLILIGGDSEWEPKDGAARGVASYPKDATVLLTHRAPTMRKHSGQVAFPGGGREDQDDGPIATAIREAQEETGLNPESVEPLAIMQPIYIDRSNFAVIPVLAYWRTPHRVYCASAENDWVEPYPISELANPERRFRVEFMQWNGPAWKLGNLVLWGFTGGVISAMLQRAGWDQPWNDSDRVDLFSALKQSDNGEALGQMHRDFTHAGPEGGAP